MDTMPKTLSQVEEGSARSRLGLGLLLAGMALVGALFVAANSRGWLSLLGWSKRPGFILLAGLLVLAVGLLRLGRPIGGTATVAVLFSLSLFLDQIFDAVRLVANIFPLPVPIGLLIALSPPLVAGYFVYRMRVPVALQGAFAFLGGYIQAVHVYNAFHPAQHMGFFCGGWTS